MKHSGIHIIELKGVNKKTKQKIQDINYPLKQLIHNKIYSLKLLEHICSIVKVLTK